MEELGTGGLVWILGKQGVIDVARLVSAPGQTLQNVGTLEFEGTPLRAARAGRSLGQHLAQPSVVL